MANPVVVLNTMSGIQNDVDVINVQLTADTANGALVVPGAYVSGQEGVYSAAAPSAVTTDVVVLVKSPEIIEVNGLRVDLTDPTQFINPANRPATAYRLKVGDKFTITSDGITGTPTEGQYAVPANGVTTIAAAADLTGGTAVAFAIRKATTISVGATRKTAYQLEVIKQG